MQLRQDTRNLAAAAAAHDTTGEYTALAALKADAQQASNTRAIDVATLARITASIAQVQSDLITAASTPTQSVIPTSPVSATAHPTPPAPKTKDPGKSHGGDQGGGGD